MTLCCLSQLIKASAISSDAWTADKSWMHGMQAVKKEVDEAVEKAKKGTIPKADMLWKNIYAETLGGVMRGMDSQTKIKL